MRILGIDTSCDDTSIAIVEDGKKVLTSLLSSQVDFHKAFQGVVPEIAARKHLEAILSLLDKALKETNLTLNNIDGIGITNRPGLIGSLLVGVGTAKALSYTLNKPLIPIDHLAAHIYSNHLTNDIAFPYGALIVSGGHTLLCYVEDNGKYKVIGTTLDDAVGEAYDKVAKHFNLGYPGGPIIDKLAKNGVDDAIKYPLIMLDGKNKFNFSYSGLKTAVIYQTPQFTKQGYEASIENIALGFQKSAINVLYKKSVKFIKENNLKRISISGGVAANSYLRQIFLESDEFTAYVPEMKYTTDNAAMVGGLAYHIFNQNDKDEFNSYNIDCHSRVVSKK